MNSKFDTGSDWLTRLAWGIIFSFGFIAIFAEKFYFCIFI